MAHKCRICKDKGFLDKGKDDFPCYCEAGQTALFYHEGVEGKITGAEVRRHFLWNSPEPIKTNKRPIPASSLPSRRTL